MIMVLISRIVDYDLAEIMENTLVFGFPGFVIFIIAMILSLKDDSNEKIY